VVLRLGFAVSVALALVAGLPAGAAAQEQAPFDWRGLYVGLHTGGALGLVDVEDPFGPSIFGDTVRTPGMLAGGQAGYNWQLGAMVLGLEADASWADMDGTNTCFAYSGFYISANCQTHIDALGTLTGRVGWVLPFDPATLLYAKGGLAWEHGKTDATANDLLGTPSINANAVHWGWTLGAGAERAVSYRWSLKAEYDFLSFSGAGFSTPASLFETVPAVPSFVTVPSAAAHIAQDIHQFTIGMNYHLGADGTFSDADLLVGLLPPGPAPTVSGTEVTAGVRYVHGWGQFHKDLSAQNVGVTSLASRLTYDSNGTDGAELFGRLDSAYDVMVKGVLGGGGGGGDMNDEDWGLPSPPFAAFVPYSNTLSGVDERINYAIIDVGYDWWRGDGYTVAPFIGYSYFRQNMQALGCEQIANPNSDCAHAIPESVVGITEDDTWRAARLGAAVNFAVAPRLTLSGEAAYLPYVSFTGTDDHVLRSLLSPEDGHGIGVQLEAMLTYAVTSAFSIGVGGRYWSLWTTSGNVNFGGTGEIVPMRYAVEQAHLLLQASYRLDVPELGP
jgi:opacity protein-like surface antigen/outer membrane protease